MPGYTPHHTHSHLRGKKVGGWGVESGGGQSRRGCSGSGSPWKQAGICIWLAGGSWCWRADGNWRSQVQQARTCGTIAIINARTESSQRESGI